MNTTSQDVVAVFSTTSYDQTRSGDRTPSHYHHYGLQLKQVWLRMELIVEEMECFGHLVISIGQWTGPLYINFTMDFNWKNSGCKWTLL